MQNRPRWEREDRDSRIDRNRQSKRLVFRRSLFLMLVCGVGLFIPLVIQLWTISIRDHDFYQQRATDQQLMDVSVSAHRGDILDANGDVLAMSATVYNLILAPKDLMNSVDQSDYTDEEGNEDEEAWRAAVQELRDEIIDGLMAIRPDLDRADLERRMAKENSQYEVLLTELEEEEAQAIRTFIEENKTGYYLYLTPSTKRYYPFGALASQVLGFVNSEGGAYGLEAKYEEILKGIPGRVVTGRTAENDELYNSYSNYVDAVNGYNLTLTIDSTIQSYAEQILEKGIAAYDVQDGGVCIVANPKTMEILAMASSPEFDPNNYSEIITQAYLEQLAAVADQYGEDSEEYGTAWNEAYGEQLRNKAVNFTYEPGSTFKPLVVAAALEEGVISPNDHFYCDGGQQVADWFITCHKRAGHGDQTLTQVLENSCNDGMMQIVQKLGADTFWDYLENYGLFDSTGIDLFGEGTSVFWPGGKDFFTSIYGETSVATASFGQTFKITPIQMATAFASMINGGHLLEPYVVQSVSDDDGNSTYYHQVQEVRQVISEETSSTLRGMLESVVAGPSASGRNAYMAGYRIGGKTGTSQKRDEKTGDLICSFMGFAPVDNPKVLVLLAYDSPEQSASNSNYTPSGTYISGGNIAAPMAGQLLADILDYMGVEKQYTTDELEASDTTMINVTGYELTVAKGQAQGQGLNLRTIGTGSIVTAQVPAAGVSIPGGSTVILYLGDAKPEQEVEVPDVDGLNPNQAKERLESAGLFLRAAGVSDYSDPAVTASSQSLEAGTTVKIGTVVDVRFVSNVIDYAPDET